MHIVHLALGPDAIVSSLLDWTDSEAFVSGTSRQQRLESLWQNYREYCEDQGIGDRAQKRLFSLGTLKPDSVTYTEVSQKTLSATACRYMLFWLAGISKLFATAHGSDADMYLISLG